MSPAFAVLAIFFLLANGHSTPPATCRPLPALTVTVPITATFASPKLLSCVVPALGFLKVTVTGLLGLPFNLLAGHADCDPHIEQGYRHFTTDYCEAIGTDPITSLSFFHPVLSLALAVTVTVQPYNCTPEPTPCPPTFPEQDECKGPNLVVNPSFEIPFCGSSFCFQPSGMIPGWTDAPKCPSQTQICTPNCGGSGAYAYEGRQFIEIDGQNCHSVLSQTVVTVVGKRYKLSYAYSAVIGLPASSEGLTALWNGVELGTTVSPTTVANQWTVISHFVTGTGSDTISFTAPGLGDKYGSLLDAVSLCPTS